MKRKLLFAIVALMCSVGTWAYTTTDLTNAGWTQLTSLPTPLSDYYFVFVDNGGTLMLDYGAGNHQGSDRKTMYYRTNANPFTTPTMVWTLANNTAASGAYSIKNATEPTLYLQEESGESPWFCHTHDNGNGQGVDRDWCAYNIVYADSKWTIQTYRVREETMSYVGPWDNTIENDAEVAGNKSGTSIGYFQIYAIKRVDASLNFTYKISNPSFESGIDTGWTNSGMGAQDNTYFGKTESKYAEAYQPNGTKSVKQTISGLPAGLYCLSAHAKARGVTSAKIYAGSNETAITVEDKESDYLVYFTSDGSSNVEIGFEGVGTGAEASWLAVDNFQLTTGTNVETVAADMPSGGAVAANKWYKLFIPTAGNYDVTSTNIATIYYSQDGTTIVNEGTSLTFAAAEKKSLSLSVGYLYIRSSAAQTLNVDTRFYLATTVNAETKWLNKNADGYTYAYDKGLPFTLESNNGNVVLKFSDGNYLNDVGSNWQTKAEGSKNNDWKLSAVDGGYKLLLGVNNDCELFIANSGTGLVEITHSEPNGNVWRFVQPEDALASAIATAEAHTLGFEDGEYAPYNNTTPIEALATAKAATTNDARISAYAALTDAAWTANVGEVNAIYWEDYTSGDIAGDGYIHPLGWTNTGYNTRIYSEAAGNKDTNNGISAVNNLAMMSKYNTTYGETTGYTMPLKAATIYKITFKYCGWNNTPTTNVVLTDPESNAITLAPGFRPATNNGHTNAENWYSYTGYFVSTTAGNYILAMNKVESGQQQIAIGDIDIRTASALGFLETGSPAYAAGTYPSVTLDRTFASTDRWYTLCAPFAFSKDKFAEVKVLNEVVGEGESAHMKFVDAGETVAAGTPCLVKPTSADATLTATDVAMNPATTAQTVTVGGINFIGTFSQVNLTESDSNAWVVSNNNLYNVDSDVTVGAYRAYFTVGSGSPVKALSFDFGDATGVNTIANSQQPMANGPIYNLAGQRVDGSRFTVNGSGLKTGIYIVNGKKVLVK